MTVSKKRPDDRVIALVGNPNVGKSTIFNALTGMHQHTGNWPGKTVAVAQGRYEYKGKGYILVDLPGTYSLLSQSEEERLAVEFILSGQADCIVVLCDATCLERTLRLALQVMSYAVQTVACINLLDEAKRKGISIDLFLLEQKLGVPVVGTSAGTGMGVPALRETIRNMADGFLPCTPWHPDAAAVGGSSATPDPDRFHKAITAQAHSICSQAVSGDLSPQAPRADRFLLGPWTGFLALVLMLMAVFWLTIQGANYPSALLEHLFGRLESELLLLSAHIPSWLRGLLIYGIYGTVTRVISVMLPPMLIFFPLFTLLEDLGYLPRAAFLMDRGFQCCGGCGKQVLTMAMGFGCNAVGVTGCRIISSPRERLLAILTNSFIPCNGRFPTMIALIGLFMTDHSALGACILTGFVLVGVAMTLLATKILSRTVLRGEMSFFVLELPPYRRPQITRILIRSVLDKTVFVLGRAVAVAAPCGIVIWVLGAVPADGGTLLLKISSYLEPVGRFFGMNGPILLAFLLAFPANELTLPLLLMICLGGNSLGAASAAALGDLFSVYPIDCKTAVCMVLFCMFHWPCGTTCLTIGKETGSWKWTLAALLLPTAIGVLLCRLVCMIP